jgi:hypothetical protein
MARGATGRGRGNMTGDILPKGYEMGQVQQYTPEQMDLYKRSFAQVAPESYTARLAAGDPALFQQIEAPAHRQFQELQGQTASRFSFGGGGPGAMSGRRSSGFQNYASQQASDFAQALQAQRMDIQRQAIGDLDTMTERLLGRRPYDRFAIEKEEKKPWWKTTLQATLPVAGAAVGGIYGGLPGAKLGATVGSAAGSAFA